MKKFIILFNFLFINLVLLAQNNYFLFIASENNQPYYVQTDGKTLSASSVGHVIIPQLKDSTYALHIGFPKDQFPEQVFLLKVGKKDAGYELKNLGGEGWGLFDFQTSQLVKGQAVQSKKETVSYGDVKKTDVFSTLMAGLVNDSAVLYTSIAKVEPAKEDSKTSLSDSPSSNNEIARQENLSGNESPLSKTDTSNAQLRNNEPIAKTAVPQQQETRNIDSVRNETQLKLDDSLKDNSVVTVPKERESDKVIVDSSRSRSDSPNKDASLAKSEISKGSERGKDTSVLKDVTANKPPVINNQPTPAESESSLRNGSNTNRKDESTKPSIVQVSERETNAGTEMTFFDLGSPGITDTIQILIPKESSSSANRRVGKEVEDQEKDSRGFFGRLFGKKKSKAPETDEKNTASVKGSTIEPEKQSGPAVAKTEPTRKENAKKDSTLKSEPAARNEGNFLSNFFSKIFGKKNKGKDTKVDSSSSSRSSESVAVKARPVENSSVANKKEETKAIVTNSDCRAFASDLDVDKLRVRMLGEKDADGQVNEARKYFKQKCFSSNQVKSLSSLFRNDEGRYKLLDAAYPFVSDTRNFKDLVTLLTEEYYINRFKAMVRM